MIQETYHVQTTFFGRDVFKMSKHDPVILLSINIMLINRAVNEEVLVYITQRSLHLL